MYARIQIAPLVLLADENTDFRRKLGSLLAEVGYDVDEADTLKTALEKLDSQPHDRAVVALDLFESGGHLGLNDLERFITQNIPITLISNKPEWGIVQRIIELDQDKGKIYNWILREDGPEAVLRSIRLRPTILHISDLQFGPHQRDMGSSPSMPTKDPMEIQIDKLCYDLAQELHIHPNTIVVTGDITEHGHPKEFEAAEKFLRTLAKALNLTTQAVVITPGNHDICWPDAAAAFAKAVYTRTGKFMEENEVEDPMRKQILDEDALFQKFAEYQHFYNRLYEGKLPYTDKLYDVFDFAKLDLLVVSLNSCRHSCHLNKEGWIGNDQVQMARDALNKVDPRKNRLRIAIFHHHVHCQAREDFDDRLADFANIKLSLQQCDLRILMHGHQHKSGAFRSEELGGKRLAVLAAGSLLLRDDKTIRGNQYQVLEIDTHKSKVWLHLRRYDKDRESSWGRGAWGPDTSNVYAQNGVIEFDL